MKVRFYDIKWDYDLEPGETPPVLPAEFVTDIDDSKTANEINLTGADLLSDIWGFCVDGFDWHTMPESGPVTGSRVRAVIAPEPPEPKPASEHVIRAECHDDEFRYQVRFDALPWFQQADDIEIVKLAAIDWGGDYASDAVAEFCADHDANVKRMFDNKGDCGFECRVDKTSALDWLATNRPQVYFYIREDSIPECDHAESPAS